jgi:signal recognition particle subunit SRP54
MLETIQKGFRTAKNRLKGYRELNESNIEDALRDIRLSLLEADVEFHVTKQFLEQVKERATGALVRTSVDKDGEKVDLAPGDHFIKICYDELEGLMGPADSSIEFAPTGVTKIMMVGLQGSGKTTTTGKLANYLATKHGKKVALVAADIYRPAAVDQLRVLGERLEVPVYHRAGGQPPELCTEGVQFARKHGCDVVIFDTAGRLAIDEPLMEELEAIKTRTSPENIFFVVDAMIGQDAVKTAAEFNRRLSFDGVILTKLDGDARGGAALSIRQVTGKPIKFLGMGEQMDRLEEFRPDGLASRILGFGDVLGLMKDIEGIVDEEKAEKDAERILSGRFDMTHFLDQIKTIKKMGPLKDVLEKLPFFGEMVPEGTQVDDKELVRVEAMINSMTAAERKRPELIDVSRLERIARGSGRKPQEVKGLLERFFGMRQMMGAIGQQPGLLSRIPGFRQLSQLKNLQGLDLGELFGKGGGPGGAPALDGLGDGGNPMGGAPPKAIIRQALAMKRAGLPLPPEVEAALAATQKGKAKAAAGPGADEFVDAQTKKNRRKKEKLARQSRKKARKKK